MGSFYLNEKILCGDRRGKKLGKRMREFSESSLQESSSDNGSEVWVLPLPDAGSRTIYLNAADD